MQAQLRKQTINKISPKSRNTTIKLLLCLIYCPIIWTFIINSRYCINHFLKQLDFFLLFSFVNNINKEDFFQDTFLLKFLFILLKYILLIYKETSTFSPKIYIVIFTSFTYLFLFDTFHDLWTRMNSILIDYHK